MSSKPCLSLTAAVFLVAGCVPSHQGGEPPLRPETPEQLAVRERALAEEIDRMEKRIRELEAEIKALRAGLKRGPDGGTSQPGEGGTR